MTLARWVEGLLLRPGVRVRSAEDLLRRGLRVVNREQGSGSCVVFDQWLRSLAVPPEKVSGYGRELSTHLAVAEAVAAGFADLGPGVLPVARLYGLDFLPLTEPCYDLVIPRDLADHEPVRVLLEVISPTPAGTTRKLGVR
ncbi:MAG: substrate-binding domain-containing protein [Armatimonadota bacterium]|nr:substrate-binding domain-containing protein [Armatimonadota bacterium]MDW8155018.1 substrate-binding domain-containing protein [Armatimonadota bacterium]